MAGKSVYNVIPHSRDKFTVAKLTKDLEVEASYEVELVTVGLDSDWKCNCPSRPRPCKHVRLVTMIREKGLTTSNNYWEMAPYGVGIKPIPRTDSTDTTEM